MRVGTYTDGRSVNYDETAKSFDVAGVPVSVDDVLGWDNAGQIDWASAELKSWARTVAAIPQPVQAAASADSPKKGVWASLPMAGKIGVVAGALLVISVCGSLANGGSSGDDAKSHEATAPSSVAATTPAAAPTEPADSVEPEPASDAPATVQDVMDEAFGTFDTISKKGRGDGVVKFSLGDSEFAVVKATHTGSSNFAIWSLDDSNDNVDLLVNGIGKYSGVTFLDGSSATLAKLKITASGAWIVKIRPVSSVPVFSDATSGKGDAVVIYDGDAADMKFTHKGSSNFAVHMISSEGEDLLVNEIGKYNGTIPVAAGPALLIINADGAWTVTAQ